MYLVVEKSQINNKSLDFMKKKNMSHACHHKTFFSHLSPSRDETFSKEWFDGDAFKTALNRLGRSFGPIATNAYSRRIRIRRSPWLTSPQSQSQPVVGQAQAQPNQASEPHSPSGGAYKLQRRPHTHNTRPPQSPTREEGNRAARRGVCSSRRRTPLRSPQASSSSSALPNPIGEADSFQRARNRAAPPDPRALHPYIGEHMQLRA